MARLCGEMLGSQNQTLKNLMRRNHAVQIWRTLIQDDRTICQEAFTAWKQTWAESLYDGGKLGMSARLSVAHNLQPIDRRLLLPTSAGNGQCIRASLDEDEGETWQDSPTKESPTRDTTRDSVETDQSISPGNEKTGMSRVVNFARSLIGSPLSMSGGPRPRNSSFFLDHLKAEEVYTHEISDFTERFTRELSEIHTNIVQSADIISSDRHEALVNRSDDLKGKAQKVTSTRPFNVDKVTALFDQRDALMKDFRAALLEAQATAELGAATPLGSDRNGSPACG